MYITLQKKKENGFKKYPRVNVGMHSPKLHVPTLTYFTEYIEGHFVQNIDIVNNVNIPQLYGACPVFYLAKTGYDARNAGSRQQI